MAVRNSNKSDNRSQVTKIVTPAGEALFPRLVVPDTKFNPDGVYSLKLRLPDGPEADSLIQKIDSVAEEAYNMAVEAAPNPAAAKRVKKAEPSYSRELDKQTGEDTGNWLFNFKMTASGVSKRTGRPWERKPALFDSQGTPITTFKDNSDIYSGTLLRVAAELRPFNSPSFGAGCSQILSAVQIIVLVSGGNQTAEDFGFSQEDDGFYISEKVETPFDTASEQKEADDDADF